MATQTSLHGCLTSGIHSLAALSSSMILKTLTNCYFTTPQLHAQKQTLPAYDFLLPKELLPELAWLGLSIPDRHHQLSEAGQLVRDAASAAIAVQNYQKAVEWLDQGRSVIWGQLLNLRTPVDELRNSHPDLATELVSLSTSLETAGTRSNAVVDGIEPPSLQLIAQKSHAFALSRDRLLQQIRGLAGFESFLLPKPISELSQAAKMGPVAIRTTKGGPNNTVRKTG
ncbi:hypothetical protein B0H13DRAFT_1914356 [Mycena leptocephala]|nr:hypothetical protein B0H13DRAFT_1914356 [Mycena leptocephala]